MKKFFTMAIALVLALSICAIPAMAAQMRNSNDSFWTFAQSQSRQRTDPRVKDNTTSMYIYVESVNPGSAMRLNAWGTNSLDRTDAATLCNNGFATFGRTVYEGSRYFVYNDVKEKGYPYAMIELQPANGWTGSPSEVAQAQWSPDSVPQSGVIQI